jgi:hypothetical protein
MKNEHKGDPTYRGGGSLISNKLILTGEVSQFFYFLATILIKFG